MRLVRFGGAMSLDGYIAGPNGEFDWIAMDPDVDFAGHMAQFDTYLIGRKTFEAMRRMGSDVQPMPGTRNVVCSRTLQPEDYPGVEIVDDAVTFVTGLRAQRGKDIAIFGGGELFRSLLSAGLVDRVEMAVLPVLLAAVFHSFRRPPHRSR